MSTSDVFEVILEKKGRGKNFAFTRPWAIRTFKLKKQTLEYYDRDTLKGSVDLKGAAASVIPPSEADGKDFPFVVSTTAEKIILNASSAVLRDQCIERFNQAAADPNWATNRTVSVAMKDAAALQETLAKAKEPEPEPQPEISAAVANMFVSNVETALLEKEVEKIEEEIKEEVSAEVASIFQEALADQSIELAHQAEEEQKVEQVNTISIHLYSIYFINFLHFFSEFFPRLF
jgi:hypothetical protein